MSYRSAARTLVLAGKASVRLSPARLDAGTISTVLGEGGTVLALSAGKSVTVAKGNYEGRAEAASYEAGARRIILTGRPVLTDGKGGSARGAKLTFDLADDKISIENEGTGRATTVVRS
jgi:lipopolysaccharide export system protein LptA